MDSMDLSEDSIQEIGVLFEAALREVAAELNTDDLAGLERRLQAVGRTILGQVVERICQDSESLVAGSQMVGYPLLL